DDGKENGAERRDEAEVLGHDAGTLAETATRVLKEFLKTRSGMGGRARSGRLAHEREQHVGGLDDGRKAGGTLAGHAHGDLRAPGLVQRLGQLLAQTTRTGLVQLD